MKKRVEPPLSTDGKEKPSSGPRSMQKTGNEENRAERSKYGNSLKSRVHFSPLRNCTVETEKAPAYSLSKSSRAENFNPVKMIDLRG
jgi:hypothetical protein